MKKYELLLYYLDLKISILSEKNLDAYDKYIRQGGEKDEDYQYVRGTYKGFDNAMRLICELLDELVVKELPPVTPQEPFMNKPCVAHQVCHEDKVKILNKIRAEIEQTAKDYDKFADYRRVRGLWIALEIIDKYKAESEE